MDQKMTIPCPFGKVSTHQKPNGQAGYAFQNDNKIRAKQVQ